MDKQALIDKAVEDLKGVLRNHKDYWFENGEMWLYFPEGSFDRIQLCKTEEFTQRASELGWVSGYLWGKEYPTNGKKPDLPKDLRFKVTGEMIGGRSYQGEFVVDECDWNDAITFCITDSRYKPKQPEPHSKPSVDKSWHEKGELPPVGTVCEYDFPNPDVSWQKVKVNYMSGINAILTLETGEERHTDNFGPKHFRPFKSEREKFVEAALEFICESGVITKGGTLAHEMAGNLYDSGCRFVSQESIR